MLLVAVPVRTRQLATSHHEWFQFTRTSNLYLGGYVPIWPFFAARVSARATDYTGAPPLGYSPLHVQAGLGEGATGGSGGLGAGPHEGKLMSSGRLWAWTLVPPRYMEVYLRHYLIFI